MVAILKYIIYYYKIYIFTAVKNITAFVSEKTSKELHVTNACTAYLGSAVFKKEKFGYLIMHVYFSYALWRINLKQSTSSRMRHRTGIKCTLLHCHTCHKGRRHR